MGKVGISVFVPLFCQLKRHQGTRPTSHVIRAQLDISETVLISGLSIVNHIFSCLPCSWRVSEAKFQRMLLCPSKFGLKSHHLTPGVLNLKHTSYTFASSSAGYMHNMLVLFSLPRCILPSLLPFSKCFPFFKAHMNCYLQAAIPNSPGRVELHSVAKAVGNHSDDSLLMYVQGGTSRKNLRM